jgi:uncharacterized protein with HEPN domain
MRKDYLNYIKHIQDECKFIESVIGEHTKKEDFLQNEIQKRAVARSIEIIGEATKKIPVDFKVKWHTITWKNMAGMRDRLIHDYMGVNYSIVWDVAKNKIPELHKQIIEVLEKEQ